MATVLPATHAERRSITVLVIPLLLLALATGYLLFLSSDENVQALFVPCIERQSPLAQAPIIGVPVCCLLSFFQAALDSRRSAVIMGEILAYVGALMTITYAEAARSRTRHNNRALVWPVVPWLVFNLAGGAVIWQLWLIPALILAHRSHQAVRRDVLTDSLPAGDKKNIERSGGEVTKANAGPSQQESTRSNSTRLDSTRSDAARSDSRTEESEPQTVKTQATVRAPESAKAQCHFGSHLSHEHVHIIPLALVVGYLLPCVWMVLQPSPLSIGVWLFFPAYVSLIVVVGTRLCRSTNISPLNATSASPSTPNSITTSSSPSTASQSKQTSLRPEAHSKARQVLYGVPITTSVLAHLLLLSSYLLTEDDRSATTRAALGFIQLDFTAIGLTVLYWVLVTQGLRTAVKSLVYGVFLGPGAGLCIAWIQHEAQDERRLKSLIALSSSGDDSQ